MEVEKENTTSAITAEPSVSASDGQDPVSSVNASLPDPIQPVIPQVIAPSVVPPLAPIPALPPRPPG